MDHTASFWYSGCCLMGRSRQLECVQPALPSFFARFVADSLMLNQHCVGSNWRARDSMDRTPHHRRQKHTVICLTPLSHNTHVWFPVTSRPALVSGAASSRGHSFPSCHPYQATMNGWPNEEGPTQITSL